MSHTESATQASLTTKARLDQRSLAKDRPPGPDPGVRSFHLEGEHELNDWALHYAALGLAVFPLAWPISDRCSCRKSDCQSIGKHPIIERGFHKASTDPDQISEWWNRWPLANIGLPTGHMMDVLDLDGHEAIQALHAHAPNEASQLDGPSVVTGKGAHLWMAPTGTKSRTGMLPKVDWRGNGGYVVAPPSLHASGDRYRWLNPDRPLLLPPRWLASLVSPEIPKVRRTKAPTVASSTRYGRAALSSEITRLANTSEGSRNHRLNEAAFNLGQLVAEGALEAPDVINSLASVATDIGLADSEIFPTIESGMKAGLAQKRVRK